MNALRHEQRAGSDPGWKVGCPLSRFQTVQELLSHRVVKTTMIYSMCFTEGQRVPAARWMGCEPVHGGCYADPHKNQ